MSEPLSSFLWGDEILRRYKHNLYLRSLFPTPPTKPLSRKERAKLRREEMARRRAMCRQIMKYGYLDE